MSSLKLIIVLVDVSDALDLRLSLEDDIVGGSYEEKEFSSSICAIFSLVSNQERLFDRWSSVRFDRSLLVGVGEAVIISKV